MSNTTRVDAEEIIRSPKFKKLLSARATLRWGLSFGTLFLFFGLITLIWTARAAMGTGMGGGIIPIWFALFFGVIFLVIVFTGFYVRVSNARFDEMTNELVRELGQ